MTDPEVHRNLARMLDGKDVDAATAALSGVVARLVESCVDWPESFGPEQFGELVGGHALDTVNFVKATDREAAHVDEKYTRQKVEEVHDAVDSSRVVVLDGLEATEQRILDVIREGAEDEQGPTHLAHALLVGPLRHAGVTRGSRPCSAPRQRRRIASRRGGLSQHRFPPEQAEARASCRESAGERAALWIAQSGDVDRATAVLLEVAETRISRGARWGVESVARTLEGLLGNEGRWLVDALMSRMTWPEREDPALENLRVASERAMDGKANVRWVAAYVDLLSVQGQHELRHQGCIYREGPTASLGTSVDDRARPPRRP